jgi:hypothetical protein
MTPFGAAILRIMSRLLCGLVLITGLLAGADVSGTWQATVETDAGSGTPTFVLKQTGETIGGTYSGALGQAQVSGSVKGADVVIQFEVEGAKVVYSGRLDEAGPTIKGKVDLAGMASGTFTAVKK